MACCGYFLSGVGMNWEAGVFGEGLLLNFVVL